MKKMVLLKAASIIMLGLLLSTCHPEYFFGGAVETDITGLLASPVRNAPRPRRVDDMPQYTCAIAWVLSDSGEAFTGNRFAAGTGYTAILTFTARVGYNFESVTANSFIHDQAISVTNAPGNTASNQIRVFVSFPNTMDASILTVSDISFIDILDMPFKGETPQFDPPLSDQYTAVLEWYADGVLFTGTTFEPSTEYQAVITFTVEPGFTMHDLTTADFSFPGAEVHFVPAEDDGVLTITFPRTVGPNEDNRVVFYSLTELIDIPERNAAVPTLLDHRQFTGAISWEAGGSSFIGDNFGTFTGYDAVVTLTAADGFTFLGIDEDTFIHNDALIVSHPAGTGRELEVRLSFAKTEPIWRFGGSASEITALTPLACCWHYEGTVTNDHRPRLMVDGNLGSIWHFVWGDSGAGNSDFEAALLALDPGEITRPSSRSAHNIALEQLGLPPAHFFSFDKGEVRDVVAMRYHPRFSGTSHVFSADQNMGEWEIWASDTPIGVDPRTNAVKVAEGEFRPVQPGVYGEYFVADLTELRVDGGQGPIQTRYLQLRVLSAFITTPRQPGDIAAFHMAELHFGIQE